MFCTSLLAWSVSASFVVLLDITDREVEEVVAEGIELENNKEKDLVALTSGDQGKGRKKRRGSMLENMLITFQGHSWPTVDQRLSHKTII